MHTAMRNACRHITQMVRNKIETGHVHNTKYVSKLLYEMLKAGILTSVRPGTGKGPAPIPVFDATAPPPPPPPPVRPKKPKTQRAKPVKNPNPRLWIEFAYTTEPGEGGKQERVPLLKELEALSGKGQWCTMHIPGLKGMVLGKTMRGVPGLQPGEKIFMTTSKGMCQPHQALQWNVGGLLLARAYLRLTEEEKNEIKKKGKEVYVPGRGYEKSIADVEDWKEWQAKGLDGTFEEVAKDEDDEEDDEEDEYEEEEEEEEEEDPEDAAERRAREERERIKAKKKKHRKKAEERRRIMAPKGPHSPWWVPKEKRVAKNKPPEEAPVTE